METQEILTWEQIRQLLAETALVQKETALQFKEIEKQFAETDKQFKEIALQSKETDKQFKEIALQYKETDKQFKEIALQSKETDLKFKENAESIAQTNSMINRMTGHFDKQLGKLVEALIGKNTLNLFIERGIKITHSKENITAHFGKTSAEYDLILQNDTDIAVVEAKVTLNEQKIYQLIKKAESFKIFMKEFKNHSVYFAAAYINTTQTAKQLAEENGIFLLELKENDLFEFANQAGFEPKAY